MNNKRIEFKKSTKEIIRRRAGYKCSFPGCGKTIVGPGKKCNDYELIGEVAHIFSAKPNGPRSNGGLSEKELKQPNNGILLCRNHHKIVDSNKGNKFSSEALLSYKSLHEQNIALEVGSLKNPFGWIEYIEVNKSHLFKDVTKLLLGKVTYFYGENASGKTSICKFIEGAFDIEKLSIWNNFKIEFSIKYYNPLKKNIKVCNDDESFYYLIEGNKHFINPYDFTVISIFTKKLTSCIDDIDFFSKLLEVSRLTIESMIKNNTNEIGITTEKFEIRERTNSDGEKIKDIYLEVGNNHVQPFKSLSSGEKSRAILDISIGIARFLSKYKPILLVIDYVEVNSLSNNWIDQYISYLFSNKVTFQTIWVSSIKRKNIDWVGWQIAKFNNRAPNAEIIQDTI